MCVLVCMHMCARVYVHVCICVRMHVCMCMRVCERLCVHMCVVEEAAISLLPDPAGTPAHLVRFPQCPEQRLL